MSKKTEEVLREIENELKYILVIEKEPEHYKPIKNTTKQECYKSIYNISEILRRYKDE